jgi:GT2 family glycosyltransferase
MSRRVPRVSAIIPSYNAATFLPLTLDSALGQTVTDLEVIVADDGSTDGTAEVVARYGDRVRYLRQANAGVSAARNLALGVATGEFIAYVDSDDLWYPKKVERLLAAFDEWPDAGIIHSDVSVIDEQGTVLRRRFNHEPPRPVPQGDCLPQLLEYSHVQLCSVMERRTVTEALGGFDRRFHGTEDYYRWLVAAMRGVRFGYVDEPLASYRWRSGSLSGGRNWQVGLVRVFEVLLAEEHLEERFGAHTAAVAQERLRVLRRELAYREYRDGDIREARRLLRLLLTERPHDPTLLRDLAKASLQAGLARRLRRWRGRDDD